MSGVNCTQTDIEALKTDRSDVEIVNFNPSILWYQAGYKWVLSFNVMKIILVFSVSSVVSLGKTSRIQTLVCFKLMYQPTVKLTRPGHSLLFHTSVNVSLEIWNEAEMKVFFRVSLHQTPNSWCQTQIEACVECSCSSSSWRDSDVRVWCWNNLQQIWE